MPVEQIHQDAPVRRHLFGRHFEIQHLGTVDALNDNLRERGASRVLAVEILVFFDVFLAPYIPLGI